MTNRTPPNEPNPQAGTSGAATAGTSGTSQGPPTGPRGFNPPGPHIHRSGSTGSFDARTEAAAADYRAALEQAERLVAQTTTQLAAQEARAAALDQQVQAMQAQGPSVLAALDSQSTNKVPRWGAAAGDFSAELWLNQVRMLQTMNKWTDEQTKEACFLSMEGAAATWKQAVLRDEGPNALATFDAFREAFLKRFKKLKTPAESVQLVAQLKQSSAETCLDFYDRCTNSIHEAHEEDLKGLLNQPEARAGYQQAIKLTIRQHFVAGLHSDIKAQISAKLQSLDTKEKLLTAAAEIEAAVRPRNAAAAVAAIGSEVSKDTAAIGAMKKELDAIRSRFNNLNLQGGGGARRKQRGKGQRATNQAAAARRAAMSTAEKVAERKRWAFCTKCRQWGLHYHDECPRSAAEIARLTPQQKERGEPGQKPFDKAF